MRLLAYQQAQSNDLPTDGHADLEPGGKVGDALLRVGGDHGHAVAGRHEEPAAQDHVAIAVAVAGRPQVRGTLAPLPLHQRVRIGQVGVRVPAAKVLQRRAVPGLVA